MTEDKRPSPGYLWSLFALRCPRCRKGKLFTNNNAYGKFSLKHVLDMPERCSECGLKYEKEPGFWFGTGYVSYALAVAISVASFIAWWVIVGVGGNKIFYWLGFQAILLFLLQPWMMRFSRSLYLSFFVGFDPHEHEVLDK